MVVLLLILQAPRDDLRSPKAPRPWAPITLCKSVWNSKISQNTEDNCYSIKVIGAQGLGALGDRTKRADRHEVPEESTTKQPNQI